MTEIPRERDHLTAASSNSPHLWVSLPQVDGPRCMLSKSEGWDWNRIARYLHDRKISGKIAVIAIAHSVFSNR